MIFGVILSRIKLIIKILYETKHDAHDFAILVNLNKFIFNTFLYNYGAKVIRLSHSAQNKKKIQHSFM